MSWSRPLFVFAAIILPIGLSGCGGGPKLSVESQVMNFGYVDSKGKNIEIPLTNAGPGRLKIYEVATSCACAVADSPREIDAGETKNLVMTIPGRPGPNSSRLLIRTNDSSSPHEFFFTWFGEFPPRLVPPNLVKHQAIPGSTWQQPVKISWAGGDRQFALEVKKLDVSNPAFKIQYQKSDLLAKQSSETDHPSRPGAVGETELLFECKLPDMPGNVSGTCTIVVSQAGKEYEMTLPVDIQVVGAIAPTPRRVLFSAAKPKELIGLKRRVALRVTSPGEVSVVEAPGFLRSTVKKESASEPKSIYVLELEMTELPPRDKSEFVIAVQLAGNPKSKVTIPVEILALN